MKKESLRVKRWSSSHARGTYSRLAQLAERWSYTPEVARSWLAAGTDADLV
jgi:hypothetical protein